MVAAGDLSARTTGLTTLRPCRAFRPESQPGAPALAISNGSPRQRNQFHPANRAALERRGVCSRGLRLLWLSVTLENCPRASGLCSDDARQNGAARVDDLSD